MTKLGYFSCVCRRINSTSPNVRNIGLSASNLGAVLEPTRCLTNGRLQSLSTFALRLQYTTADLCSAQQQHPLSELLFTTDKTLRKFHLKDFSEKRLVNSISDDFNKAHYASHSSAYSLWPTSCQREHRITQPSTGGLFSSSTHTNLPDTALLAYYSKTGVLSKRWICTTTNRTHPDKQSVDRDDKYKGKQQNYNSEIDESKLTLIQKFKLMYRQYWYVLLPVHCATSVVWYGSFFIAAKNGVDIVPLLKALGITSETILGHLQDSNTGYYALAYAMYKVATPARYTVTVGCTTFSINYLKNKGYIKPAPSPEQLKNMYEDKRDEMLERSNEMREQFQARRDELQDKLDQRRALVKSNLKERRDAMRDRREAMIDRFEERRDELRHRFGASSDRLEASSDRLEEGIDQIKQHEEKLVKQASGKFNEMKENLELKTVNIKKTLEGVEQEIAKDVFKTDDTKK